MKTKVKRLSKRSLAVFLGVLMLVTSIGIGSLITANAAGINLGGCSYVGLNFENGSGGTINGASSDQYRVNFTKDSNNNDHWYSGYIYVKTSSSGWNYYTKFVLNWGGGDKWWAGQNEISTYNSNVYPVIYENGSSDTLKAPGKSIGYVRLQFDAYNNTGEKGNGRYIGFKVNTADVSNLSFSSLTPANSTLSVGETTNLMPSVSGGSSSYNYTYSVKNKSTNEAVSCISGSTFTAPIVESTTVYTVTCTAKDNNCPDLASKTKTCDITVNPPNVIYVDNKSGNSTIYIYAYSGSDKKTGNWPGWQIINSDDAASSPSEGVTITKLNNGIYKIVGIPTANNAIFNSGSNAWQTGDDAAGGIVDKRLYTLNSDKTITKTDYYSEGPDYYITGEKGLVGENWGQTPSSGQMSLDSGTTYTKTFSNVAAGSYEFRITSSDDNELTSGWSSYSDYTITTSGNDDILTVSQSQSDSNNVKMSLSDPADITITFNTAKSGSKYPVTITAIKKSESGSWKYSGDNSDATPEIASGSTTYKFLYNSGHAGNLADNNVTPTKNGNDYWYDFTGKYTAGTNFYVGLASGTTGNSLLGTGNQQKINGTKYANNNGYSNVVISDSNGDLFTLQLQAHNSVKGGSVPFLKIHTIQSRVTSIGVRATFTNSSDPVDYKVYYKLSGGGETASTVDVYAKSGTLRDGNETMGSYATSKIYKQDGTTEYAATDYLSGQNWKGGNCKSVAVKKGKIITVETTIASDQRSTYYVKGFDVNGVTYGLIKDESSITPATREAGEYSTQIEIDADTEDTKIEITPIIYKFGESRTRFYIDGFDNVPETEGWGKTIYVYPFYGNLDGKDNSYKAYPGQAVITDGGKRYIDIPDTVGSTAIKGVTMSNGYWDTVHRAIEGWPNDNSAYHKQTYDYDDFYKIKQEVPAGKTLKDIIFYFKYKDGYKGSRTTEQDAGGNTAPASFTDVTTSTWKNDWEPLTDYYGRYVDIFGNVLDPQPSKPTAGASGTIHVVSNGYVNNNAGYFGTEWNVYTKSSSTYTRQTQISSSALLMQTSSSFDNYSGTKWSTYKTAYNTLNTSTYKNKPVVITYENALYGGKKPDNSYDRAVRNDGRWYATYIQDTINANIKIQKIGGSDADWTDDTFKNTNQGTTTNAKAYFTNTSVTTLSGNVNLNEKVTATNVLQSNTGDFTFEVDNSELSASYKFVGWFRQTATGDISSISKNSSASSSMSANDTYIARYRYTGAATVKINHTLFPGSALGKTYVSAVVTHADGASPATTSYSETSGTLTIPMKSDYQKITVTLKSSSTGDNKFRGFYTGTDSGDLIDSTDTNTKVTNKTQTIEILQSDVFNSNDTPKKETFNYYSKFDDVTETISVVYTYTNRFGSTKKYRAERVLDANYLEAYSTSGTGDNRRYALNTKTIISDPSTKSGSYTIKEWIMDFAPKVDDLDKNSTWNLANITHTDGQKTYTLTATHTNKTHKVKLTFTKNGSSYTSEVLTVADDAFTKTSDYGGLMGYTYNDASSNFKYWAVWSAKEDNGELVKTGEKEYARCYNRFFSLTIPEDSYIEAVYEYESGEENGDIAAIREPVFTREISNADANGNFIMNNGKVVTTDVIYADFVVSYMTENYGVQLNTDEDKDKFDTGVIMEFNQNVSIDDNIASTITDKKFDSNIGTIKTNLNTYLSSGGFNGKNYTNYTAPTNGTYSSTGKNALYYYSIDNTKYNDLNRYDYFLKFNNTNTWRKRVMKAYYYVKEKSTGNITLSDPVYFAINVIGNSEATVVGATS